MAYYPVFLEIKDAPCVVVGGGEVAARKTAGLAGAGAVVTVISPKVTESLGRLVDNVQVRHLKRPFQRGDTRGACLVVAASSDRGVNKEVLEEARAAGIPVNVADDPGASVFIVPSVVRRGGLTVAVSTGGKCPALARRVRLEIEKAIGPEYGPLLEIMGRLRESLLKKGLKGDKKDRIINELLDSDMHGLIKEGDLEGLERLLLEVAGSGLEGLGLTADKAIEPRMREDDE
jgi:precorrin-2 dehydrogenase/sirohydrochlorin ferrochelatase